MGLEKNKVNRVFGIVLIILIVFLGAVILLQISSIFLGPSTKACTKKVCLSKFLEGPPAFNDEKLRNYLKERFMFDSRGPSNYMEKVGYNSTIEQAMNFILSYFGNKRGGSFAVLGAGDGEYQDLTIPLEKNLGWSGLLIEPHPELFQMMKRKGRTATLTNACVSPFAYPSINVIGHKKVDVGDSATAKFHKYRGTKIKQLFQDDTDIISLKVQCIPLENLIYAAGFEKTLDLMILDMSGSDLDIIVNVKLDVIPDIEMIVVRCNGETLASEISGYFLDKNLVLKKTFGTDPNQAIYILTKFRGEEEF